MAFESQRFVDNIYKPMLERHRSLTSRTEKAIPLEEYEVASGILQDEETNRSAKGGDRVARAKILSAQRTAKMFEQQEGLSFDEDQMEQPEPSTTEPSSPQFKEGKIYNQGGIRYRYTNGQFVPLS